MFSKRPQDDAAPPPEGDTPPPPDTLKPRHPVLVWGERIITAAVLVFVFIRLGPQLGALLGVGPDLGRSPDYEVTTLDGDHLSSDALLGKVVVLNFWATWCGPCKLEMPVLQGVHEDRASDGVVVLGLATDAGRGDGIAPFLSERGITYPIGRATQAHRQAFGGISVIPTTFLIDKSGVVRHRIVGYLTSPALRVAVNRLLEEETAGPLPTPAALSAGTVSAR